VTAKKISPQAEERIIKNIRKELRSEPALRSSEDSAVWWYLIAASACIVIIGLMGGISWLKRLRLDEPQWNNPTPAPLVMKQGDPYIRALMRTISGSESNSPRPYSILYGGEHVDDLSRHPDDCVLITVGPNTGNCSTAAGRYQMLTTTWEDTAKKYHPNQPWGFWGDYDFSPEYQDEVVYRWLSDSSAWGVDLSQLLREGKIEEVLQILSPTWTSLGYGIETNSMSSQLPSLYQHMLQEELP
jgi:muramidase (phage lysozyme)